MLLLRFPAVLFLICSAAVLPAEESGLPARLAEIFGAGAPRMKSFGPAAWLDKGTAYTTLESGEIVRYATATGAREVLISAKQLTPEGRPKPLTVAGYAWTGDQRRLLVFTNTRKVWRLHTRGDYWVLDRTNGKLRQVGGKGEEASLLFAKFSPDGKSVAFVRGNNLYREDVETGKVRQLTTDGSATLINGTSDWAYEEELGVRDGYRWSPDSRSLAYWQFDSSGVGVFNLINNTDATYPKLIPIPYPKVGTANSAVRVGVVSAGGGKTKWMAVPGDPRENYIAGMRWQGKSLVLQQLNRLQNRQDLLEADAKTGQVKQVFQDKDETWVDAHEPEFLADGSFVVLSERDGWRRAYRVVNGAATAVTPDGVDVMRVARIAKDQIYYVASPERATERHLYRVNLQGGAAERLSAGGGTHSYDVAASGEFAFHTYSTMNDAPTAELVSLPDHRRVRVLAENKVETKGPPAEFFKIAIAGGVEMDAWMIKPANFDAAKRYPVLVYVYGEPAGVTVTDSWQGARGLYHRAIADQGYVVVSMDNRGTPAPKGRAWRKVVYGSVGVLSAAEQAAGLKALLAMRPYLDGERVAIWGWSGGGSNTLNAMFRTPGLYKVGMSVAPVPDQQLYDTIYQERYMGVPKDNAKGYREGSPISFAEGLEGKLLIVHGTGDDNCHYQGVERLANRLVELGKPFDMMAYPNRSHSINEGKGTSLHIHSLMGRYLMEHLAAGGR